jgi:DNA-binding GntR family transcriptional regulator
VKILNLVEAGDGAGARRAIEEHIAHTRDRLISHGEMLMANAQESAAES